MILLSVSIGQMAVPQQSSSNQLPGPVFAGVVLDSTGAAVPRAVVRVTCSGGVREAVSGLDGSFQIACGRDMPSHSVSVEVDALGFATLHETVLPGTHLRLTLTLAEVQGQATVTATRSSVSVGAGERSLQVLNSAALQSYPAPTLDDALRQHAGFELFRRSSSRVTNPTSQGISLRGLGSTAASRTLVLSDGVPLNDPFGGWVHWNEFPESILESATLVSGGGSDLYGSSAMAGVIDLTPVAPAPPVLQLSASGGSQSTAVVDSRAAEHFRGLDGELAAEFLRTGGYTVVAPQYAGPVDIAANVNSTAVHTELGRRAFASQRLFFTGNLLQESRSNGTPLQSNGTRLWRYLVGYDTRDSAAVPVRARLFGSTEGYRQSFSSINAARSAETLTRLQRVRTDEAGATVDATVPLGRLALVTGADVRDIRATDAETPVSAGRPNGFANTSARQRFSGGFVELLGAAGSWSGAASLRLDAAQNLAILQSTPAALARQPDRTEWIPSPRVGLTRTLTPLMQIHASAFRAFRSPTMNELYRTGQVGQETTLANPALLSERATGYEAGGGLHSRNQSRFFTATWFWTTINRPVSAVLIAQTATTLINQRQNLGQIRSEGVELAGQAPLGSRFGLTAGYQFAGAVVTRFSAQPGYVGNRIPQVPRHSVTGQLHFADPRLLEATLAFRHSSAAFDDAANQYRLAGFTALDLSLRRRLYDRLEATAVLQNLTDQRPQVARTPVLTLGSPFYLQVGLRLLLTRGPK